MMRWPWTSCSRLDDALDQVAHLRTEVTRLSDALTRISRREVGLPEVPREPRPALQPMPQELREYISGFASASVQKAMRDTAYRQHAAGKPWADIIGSAMTEEEKVP